MTTIQDRIGRHEIRRRLSEQGGTGMVFLADDPVSGGPWS